MGSHLVLRLKINAFLRGTMEQSCFSSAWIQKVAQVRTHDDVDLCRRASVKSAPALERWQKERLASPLLGLGPRKQCAVSTARLTHQSSVLTKKDRRTRQLESQKCEQTCPLEMQTATRRDAPGHKLQPHGMVAKSKMNSPPSNVFFDWMRTLRRAKWSRVS